MLVHDAKHLVEERGFLRVMEPCVGSGAMVIALARALREKSINYQQALHVTAIDCDIIAVHMAYVQCTLLHIPAVVLHGDSLRGETYSVWRTLAHVMGLWDVKLVRDHRTPPAQCANTLVPHAAQTAEVSITASSASPSSQLRLF